MSNQTPVYLTPPPDDEGNETAGTVEVDGKAELDGDLDENAVNSYAADRKAATQGEAVDDETA